MPELPEVETIRRQLCEAGVEGRIIETVQIDWPRTVEPLTPAAFSKQITGRKIEKLSRHGKWLIFHLDDSNPPRPEKNQKEPTPACSHPSHGGDQKISENSQKEIPSLGGVPERRGGSLNLLVHLRMTGGFSFSPGSHDRIVLHLSGGMKLYFRDPRKFGRWRLADSLDGLGPDALTVTKKEFFQALEKSKKRLKPLLLDQSFIAGVGNIYADEALFEARLDPRRRSGTLSAEKISKLWKAVRRVIEAGVRNGGTSLGDGQGNYVDLNGEAGGHREKVKVYGRAGLPCVVCKQLLHKTQIAQRTTVFCTHCQR